MSLATLFIGRRNRILRQALTPPPRWSALELLETRQFLSVAPTANDDAYQIPSTGHLAVDPTLTMLLPVGPAPMEVVPAKPTETDQIIDVIGTERTELGPVEVGTNRHFGEINVKESGTYAINGAIPEGKGWLVVGGYRGYGQITISGGSLLSTANWTEAGYEGGFANVLLTGTGSRWTTQQFVEIGNNEGGAIFTVADGAHFNNGNWFEAGNNKGWARVLLTGAETTWDNHQFFTIGDNGGRARMTISHGARLNTNNWTEIGEGSGSNGRVVVQGEGTTWNNANWMEIGSSGGTGSLYIGKGATVKSGGSITTGPHGSIRGDGLLDAAIYNGGLVDPGASAGVLHITQHLEQLATGVLKFDIQGSARGESHDGLDVGRLAAGGELLIRFTHGYAPKAGDTFNLVRAGSISGEFAKVTIQGGLFEYKIERVEEDGQQVLRLVIISEGTPRVLPAVDPALGRGVLRNDTDPDLDVLLGDRLSLILVEEPKHGQLFLDQGGGFTYRAGPTYNGQDGFKYLADDGIFTSEPATVVITGEVEQPKQPTTEPDSYSTNEDTAMEVATEQGVLANDTGATVAHLATGPQHGELRLNPDGAFFYRPRLNFNGTDTFTYRAGNGEQLSEPTRVELVVKPVNDDPITRPDSKTTKQGVELRFPASDLLANDSDPDGDRLIVSDVDPLETTKGSVGMIDSTGTIIYTPPPNYVGTDSFQYTVLDGNGGSARGIVTVTVLRNDQPQIIGRATGYGSLNNRKQFFFFNVLVTEPGDAMSRRGHLAFFDVEQQISFVSTYISSFQIDGNTATFAGTGLVNGKPEYYFTVSVTDNSAPGGGKDAFSIHIVDLSLAPVPNFLYEARGTLDEGFGNITVRKTPPQRGSGGLKIVRAADGTAVRRR